MRIGRSAGAAALALSLAFATPASAHCDGLGPAIRLADQAVATGSDAEVATFVGPQVARGIHDRFQDLQSKRRFDPLRSRVRPGRCRSYVSFIHYVEGWFQPRDARRSHYPDAPGTQADSSHERHPEH